MCAIATAFILAATVNPIYLNHNKVVGYTPTMTNMTAWAASVITEPSTPATNSVITFSADHTAVVVNVAANGTLSADLTNWTEGQTQTAIISLASGASVSSSIILIGYTSWITGSPFIAECIYYSGKVYVNPVAAIQ